MGPVAHHMGQQCKPNAFAVVSRIHIKLLEPCVRVGSNTGDDAIGFCHNDRAFGQHPVGDEPKVFFRCVDDGHAGHGGARRRKGAPDGSRIVGSRGSDDDLRHGMICRKPVTWVKLLDMTNADHIDIIAPDEALLSDAHDLLHQQWGDSVVSLGRMVDPFTLPVRVAVSGDEFAGVAAYLIEGDELEVVALAATGAVRGTGRALMLDLFEMARNIGVRRVHLVTTNDNLRAIGFYQVIGMTIARVGINAIVEARKLKPEIPLTGEKGIPIRDEIEFEYLIKD